MASSSGLHDSAPTLVASPDAPDRCPHRVAALYYGAAHPITRLLPLASPPYLLPDAGPRAWLGRLQRVALYAWNRHKSLPRGLQCHSNEPADLWRHRTPDADPVQQRVESGLPHRPSGIGAGGWVGSYLAGRLFDGG